MKSGSSEDPPTPALAFLPPSSPSPVRGEGISEGRGCWKASALTENPEEPRGMAQLLPAECRDTVGAESRRAGGSEGQRVEDSEAGKVDPIESAISGE